VRWRRGYARDGTQGRQADNPRKAARIAARLTQPELARVAGISERALRDWEGKARVTNVETLRAIARALDLVLKTAFDAREADRRDILAAAGLAAVQTGNAGGA